MIHAVQMTDMANVEEDDTDYEPQTMPARVYPYGLCLSLTEKELAKLDLEQPQVGDMIHLFAMAKVTAVSQNETTDGTCCRVELQITHLGAEGEDDEVGEMEE